MEAKCSLVSGKDTSEKSESEKVRPEFKPFIHLAEDQLLMVWKMIYFWVTLKPPKRFLSTPRCCSGTVNWNFSFHSRWQPANVNVFQQAEYKNEESNNFLIKRNQTRNDSKIRIGHDPSERFKHEEVQHLCHAVMKTAELHTQVGPPAKRGDKLMWPRDLCRCGGVNQTRDAPLGHLASADRRTRTRNWIFIGLLNLYRNRKSTILCILSEHSRGPVRGSLWDANANASAQNQFHSRH